MWIMTLVLLSSFAYANLTTSNIVYYSFDNINLTGGNPQDLTGNGNTGTNNGATTGIAGLLEEAFTYDGTDEVLLNNTGSLIGNNDFSVSFWVNFDALVTNDRIWEMGSGNDNRANIIYHTDSIAAQVEMGSDAARVDGVTTLSTGQYYHIVLVWDNTAKNFDLYLNNSLEINDGAGAGAASSLSPDDMFIMSGGATAYTEGDLDEFSLWNRKLTVGEINTLNNGGDGYNFYNTSTTTSNITITAKDSFSNLPVNNITANITLSNGTSYIFSNSTGNIISTNIPRTIPQLLNVSLTSFNYFENITNDANATNLGVMTMKSAISIAKFIDSNTTNPIQNKDITITYPSGIKLALITNSSGSVSWSAILEEVEILGEYNITFNATDGYISPVSFLENITLSNAPLNESYLISPATLNITIRDQDTGNLITASTILTIVGIGEFNVTGGNLIIRNGSIVADTYTAYAFSDGYATGQTSFEYNAREVENIQIFLLNSTESTTGSLSVIIFDEVFNTQANVDTRLLQYFPETNSFIEVNQCFTNSNGECIFSIVVGEKLYKVTASTTVAGETLIGQSSENGEIIFIDDYQIEIHLFSDISYSAPDLLGFSITPQNTTLIQNISYLTGVWRDIYSNSHQVCIRYSSINNTIITPLSNGLNCASGISGEINVLGGYNLTTILETNDVYVELFVNETDGNEVVYFSDIYISEKSFEKRAGALAPYIIMVLFTCMIGLMLYLKNTYIFGIGTIIVSIICRRLLPTYFTWETVTAMIVLSLALFYLSRKKEGNIEV